MAVVKYSKRPVARVSASRPRLLTDTHVTIKPRFCVALLALAVAGAPVGTALAQSMAGGGGASPNATRTTLDPICLLYTSDAADE